MANFDPSTLSLFAQIPVVLLFALFMLYRDRAFSKERSTDREAWAEQMDGMTAAISSVAEEHKTTMQEQIKENREALSELAQKLSSALDRVIENQDRMRRLYTRLAVLFAQNDPDKVSAGLPEILAEEQW